MNQRNRILAYVCTKRFFHLLIALVSVANMAAIATSPDDIHKSWIFFAINVLLLVCSIGTCKLICVTVVWLGIYGVFLLCLGLHASNENITIWVPGITINPYLRLLIPDPVLLCALWAGFSWLVVAVSLVGLTLTQRVIAGERLDIVRGTVNNPLCNERDSLLPPSYSDCESPPPCYSQAVKLPGHQPDLMLVSAQLDDCPTYQEAIATKKG